MPNIVGFSQRMTDQIPEFEINLRPKMFYKHYPMSQSALHLFAMVTYNEKMHCMISWFAWFYWAVVSCNVAIHEQKWQIMSPSVSLCFAPLYKCNLQRVKKYNNHIILMA